MRRIWCAPRVFARHITADAACGRILTAAIVDVDGGCAGPDRRGHSIERRGHYRRLTATSTSDSVSMPLGALTGTPYLCPSRRRWQAPCARLLSQISPT